jgi:hypothetical protein
VYVYVCVCLRVQEKMFVCILMACVVYEIGAAVRK